MNIRMSDKTPEEMKHEAMMIALKQYAGMFTLFTAFWFGMLVLAGF